MPYLQYIKDRPYLLAIAGIAFFLGGFYLLNAGCSQFASSPELFGMSCGNNNPGKYVAASYQAAIILSFAGALGSVSGYAFLSNQQDKRQK